MHVADKLRAARNAHKRLADQITGLEEQLQSKDAIIASLKMQLKDAADTIRDLETQLTEAKKPKTRRRTTAKKKTDDTTS